MLHFNQAGEDVYPFPLDWEAWDKDDDWLWRSIQYKGDELRLYNEARIPDGYKQLDNAFGVIKFEADHIYRDTHAQLNTYCINLCPVCMDDLYGIDQFISHYHIDLKIDTLNIEEHNRLMYMLALTTGYDLGKIIADDELEKYYAEIMYARWHVENNKYKDTEYFPFCAYTDENDKHEVSKERRKSLNGIDWLYSCGRKGCGEYAVATVELPSTMVVEEMKYKCFQLVGIIMNWFAAGESDDGEGFCLSDKECDNCGNPKCEFNPYDL